MMTYWVREMQWDWKWGEWKRVSSSRYKQIKASTNPYIQLRRVDVNDLVPKD